MTDPITTLVGELSTYAYQPAETAGSYETTTATGALQPLTQAVGGILFALESVQTLQSAMQEVFGDIGTALTGAADALNTVGEQLQKLPPGQSAADALTALQNALTVASSLVPGSTPNLSSGSQFFAMLSSLLTTYADVSDAATELFKLSQQLRAIGGVFTAPQANP